jgi:hypothetical protein
VPRESGNVRRAAKRAYVPMEPGAAHGWWYVADMPFHTDCPQCNERNPAAVLMLGAGVEIGEDQ